MQSYILLFRGINVGGKNILPMKALIPLLEEAAFENVSSYIQSGNIVLKSAEDPAKKVETIVFDHFGFLPIILSLDKLSFISSTSKNPYQEFEGKFVHFYFCQNAIKIDVKKLNKYIAHSESYTVVGNVFYLHAPDGIGRSKLVANIEACLAQRATGRNMNTVNKISNMLQSC